MSAFVCVVVVVFPGVNTFMYRFYYHFNQRFRKTQHINDLSAARVVA